MLKHLFTCALIATPMTACAHDQSRAPQAETIEVAQATVDLNSLRKANRRSSLTVSKQLTEAAQKQSDYQKKIQKMSHAGRGGSTVRKRATRAGYKGCYWSENVANGYDSEAQVLQAWMTSPGHRKNMLSKSATHYGLARSGPYWTLVLGGSC